MAKSLGGLRLAQFGSRDIPMVRIGGRTDSSSLKLQDTDFQGHRRPHSVRTRGKSCWTVSTPPTAHHSKEYSLTLPLPTHHLGTESGFYNACPRELYWQWEGLMGKRPLSLPIFCGNNDYIFCKFNTEHSWEIFEIEKHYDQWSQPNCKIVCFFFK